MRYQLSDRFTVSADPETTWDFFSKAENLPAITPPWLSFRLVTKPPIAMRKDALIDYTIRWAGVPVKWRTRITDWSPPRSFTDEQVRGPYAYWRHEHTFTPVPSGTECTDHVTYQVPGWIAGDMLNSLFIKRQLLDIFRYRRAIIAERLGGIVKSEQDVEIRAL